MITVLELLIAEYRYMGKGGEKDKQQNDECKLLRGCTYTRSWV